MKKIIPILHKSGLLNHRQCPKQLWLNVNRPDLIEGDAAGAARARVGTQVGELARTLHADGLLINGGSLAQNLTDTTSAVQGKKRPIFEATFQTGGVLVRNDLLLPARGGHRLVEVKSSTAVKEHQLEDVAIQAWVAREAGVTLKHIEIAHINNTFLYQGDGNYDGLFAHVDVQEDVESLQKDIPEWIKAAQKTLAGGEPEIEMGAQCKNPRECPFTDFCSTSDEKYPPDILPRGAEVAAELREAGYSDLRKAPKSFLTKANHLRVWRVTKSGKAELDAEAGQKLAALSYPRYYLDFESMNFAIPKWAGTHPYRQVPFQWSCHIEKSDGSLEQKYFLAESDADPRRAFTESLLKVFKTSGPIFVYSKSFESGRMQELAEDFPDLASKINVAIRRLVDLLPITREHYYHRDMLGSWSIKNVLPTIAPELAYDNLEVGGGLAAQEAYVEMIDPATSKQQLQKLRDNLLKYCERDTLAMVKLAHFLQKGL